MKNNTNIYDIDGELIRSAGDDHKMTLKEAQDRIKLYSKKIEELEENDPKIDAYTTYIRNLNAYIFGLYSTMSKSELEAEMNALTAQESTNEQIKKAIDELKEEIESEAAEGGEEKTIESPIDQESMLTDGSGRPETVMDEYVEFEEV